MSEWKPIETVPINVAVFGTDGNLVGEACYCCYEDGPKGWYWATDGYPMSETLTHWMEMPLPPSKAQ